jgi:hypothetical protein
MSQRTRAGLGALVVIVAIVAFIIVRPSGTSKSSGTSSIVHIQVHGGKPVGGVQTIPAKKGGRVRFEITSDVGDEIHVHGYNLHKEVVGGGTVSFDFPASIDGIFVVELEHRSEQIASLEVQP